MKKITLLFFLLAFQYNIHSQVISDKVSVEFKNANLKTAIQNIEQTSYFKFYYDEKWLESDSTSITKQFKEVRIAEILDDVFQNTNINFFVAENKVILTNNSIIYNELPDDYFGIPLERDENGLALAPIFYQQFDSVKKTNSRNPNKNIKDIILIGKEVKNQKKKSYILSGYVRGGKNKGGIPNIVVKIPNTEFSTITDKDGHYKLQVPPGISTVETETFAYDKVSKKIMVYNDGSLNFAVTDNINQLDEVLINTNKSKNAKAAITGVTTIDAEGIKNVPLVLGERDILKVALTLPGIKTAGEGSSGYNVRGGKEDQNLFLLDNAVLYNPSHFFGFFTALNPYTTKKVDIYKGSIPAEFGGRLSSVFDITSKTGNFNKFEGEAGIGPATSNIMISTPVVKGKSSLIAGGRASYSDWILRSLDDEKLKNSQASFYDLILKYNHKINANNDIEATAYYSHDKFSVSSDSLYKYSNRLATLKWNHTFNEKNKGSLLFTNSEYRFNIDYQPENINAFDFGYKINDTQAALKMIYLYSEKHKISYGISSKLYGINPGYLRPENPESTLIPIEIDKERGLESAIYVGDNFKITDKFLLDFGLRYSSFAALGKSTQRIYEENLPISDATVVETKTYGNNEVIKRYGGFEPRVAARYFITDDFSVRASYDKTYQYIHLLSNNTTQSPTDIWKLSDLNVKPESAQQFSLGLYKNLKNDELELSVEGYFKKSRNILDYKVGADLLLNQNIETELLQGDGKAYGIEFLLKKQVGRLNGWLGYTYSRSLIKLNSQFNEEKVNGGKFFASNFDKPHDFSAVLNYRITKRYSFSSNFVYQTGRPITYPVGKYDYGNAQYTVYSDRNKFRIPDYFRLDIGLNIEGNHKIKKFAHSFWNISVYNVLGRNNPYSVFFVTDKGQIKAYKTSIFSIPIPSITYNFKF
ncbi:TonB-dependent receptor [Flavobacterium plurextorum]|uniref:TonB-dependent receptor n=1 Tax=Flavobacterium plurextorum TaxID=1114867 RepID=A0ABX4CVV7_9FLAO|nr:MULTISPECIES: TonB-dependent receptor [Flavobacterium]OXB08959.1 TonB-dependent receptor [Flavobacterium plurextorum]UUW10530.1 TonB-dependent receptor [Flavobacterium plurextorum]